MSIKSIVKKLLPAEAITVTRKIVEGADLLILRFFSLNGFLASVYFTFFSSKFYREHRAVLLGRLRFHQAFRVDGFNNVLLRRNIHRLEKGLIMRPRRDVFAEDYIKETVDCFVGAVGDSQTFSDEYKWANDVLHEYFSVVRHTEKIKKAHRAFSSVAVNIFNSKYIPYPRQVSPATSIEYDQLKVLFQRRRSVRWYLDKLVDKSLIDKAVEAASLAPSACNRQPYSFKVIDSPDDAVRIADCAMGTAGFSKNIPCIIAIVGDLSSYPAERDRHVIYIDSALASMQLMLAFETLGLSTCPINWPDIEEREKRLSRELNLQYHQRAVMLLAVGYADPSGGIPYSQKKSSAELIFSN